MIKSLTIFILNYNNERFISRCIESIIKSYEKSDKKIELKITVIDDASTDNSVDTINKWCLKYDFISSYIKEKNMSVGHSRNTAINLCNTQYMFQIDVDDYVSDNYFQTLEAIDNSNVYDYIWLSMVDSHTNRKMLNISKENAQKINQNSHSMCDKIYLASYLVENRFQGLEVNMGEDKSITPIIIANTQNFYVIEKPLVTYWKNEGSTTSTSDNSYKVWLDSVANSNYLGPIIVNNLKYINDNTNKEFIYGRLNYYISLLPCDYKILIDILEKANIDYSQLNIPKSPIFTKVKVWFRLTITLILRKVGIIR